MNYDVVIATMNRPEALKLSIPLIINQNRPPHKLIIVDASDNHENIEKTVLEAVGNNNINLEISQSKANLPHQRNEGLEQVESPIVMFPDDDSLWWSGVAEAIMRIYERDKNYEIGGVCASWETEPPPEVLGVGSKRYRMKLSDRIKQKIGELRHRFDDFVCPNPVYVHGR